MPEPPARSRRAGRHRAARGHRRRRRHGGAGTGGAAGPRAALITREHAVLAARPWVDATFRQLDPHVQLAWHAADGDADRRRTTSLFEHRRQRARPVLTGERTALNFLQLLSATATATRRYVEAVAGTGCRILDTRKTVPGLRTAQKYAVRCGGGQNHRIGLYDRVLIKENHIAAAGSIAAARSRRAQRTRPAVTVEVEVEIARSNSGRRSRPRPTSSCSMSSRSGPARRGGAATAPAPRPDEARSLGQRHARDGARDRRDRRRLHLDRLAHQAHTRDRFFAAAGVQHGSSLSGLDQPSYRW